MDRVVRMGILLSFSALMGCGSGSAKSYPVQGKVLVNGKPVGGAEVIFYPHNPAQQRVSVGNSGPDGSFQLMTLQAGDGAPEGNYDITVMWPDYTIPRDECVDPLHDRLKQRYAERGKAGLHAEIRPGNNVVLLELEMELESTGWSFPKQRDAKSPGQ